MSDFSRIIGQQIKKYRNEKELTQKDLAEALSVHPSNIAGWEVGNFSPNNDMMIRLCEYFDITLDELFGREKKPVDDELREREDALFKSLNAAGQEEALRSLRQMIAEAIAEEFDRRGQA